MKFSIKSENVVLPEGVRPGIVIVEGEKIVSVAEISYSGYTGECTDVGKRFVLPGLVDAHVHINEPGRTEWEGFETATQAAAAGGYTCLIDMPLNCIPSTTTVEALEQKRDAARGKAQVDLAFWGAVVPGNTSEIEGLAKAGVKGFKCFLTHSGTEDFQMVTEADLREALPEVAKSGLPLLAHAELPGPVERACAELDRSGADWRLYETYRRSRPPAAELEAIDLLIGLCHEYRCRTHIVHLATEQALDRLRTAREEGLPITVETCPHYLFFTAEQVPDGATEYKCAPPIREAGTREALWKALREGLLDLIATDHSPCPPALKDPDAGSFRVAWGGISSLSLSLPAIWTEASKRGFSLHEIVGWMAAAPATLAGLEAHKGSIACGLDADLVIFDPNTEWTVSPDDLYFRHACTPYLGQRLRGRVEQTYLRGRSCFQAGSFVNPGNGREVMP